MQSDAVDDHVGTSLDIVQFSVDYFSIGALLPFWVQARRFVTMDNTELALWLSISLP